MCYDRSRVKLIGTNDTSNSLFAIVWYSSPARTFTFDDLSPLIPGFTIICRKPEGK